MHSPLTFIASIVPQYNKLEQELLNRFEDYEAEAMLTGTGDWSDREKIDYARSVEWGESEDVLDITSDQGTFGADSYADIKRDAVPWNPKKGGVNGFFVRPEWSDEFGQRVYNRTDIKSGTAYSHGDMRRNSWLYGHEVRHDQLGKDNPVTVEGLPGPEHAQEEFTNRIFDVANLLGKEEYIYEVNETLADLGARLKHFGEDLSTVNDVIAWVDKHIPQVAKMEARYKHDNIGVTETPRELDQEILQQYEKEFKDRWEVAKNRYRLMQERYPELR